MNFRVLATAAVLLACVGGAGALSVQQSPGGDDVAVYRNGDLELSIRGSAGIGILRSGLANLFQDDRPQGTEERRICAEESQPARDGQAMLGTAPELGMLGAGFALLGWTRRRGNWFDRLKQGLCVDVFPWPALCWLD